MDARNKNFHLKKLFNITDVKRLSHPRLYYINGQTKINIFREEEMILRVFLYRNLRLYFYLIIIFKVLNSYAFGFYHYNHSNLRLG